MSYRRVLPRDLFNEADLLKCLGRLWIVVSEMPGCRASFTTEDVSRFEIDQDPASGAIEVTNVEFTIAGEVWKLTRPLNSRQPWPLYAEQEERGEVFAVFTTDGQLDPEFLALIQAPGE